MAPITPTIHFDSTTASSCRRVGDRLQVIATVSRVADQQGDGLKYQLNDGSIIEEYVTADELFNQQSMDTARMAPVTLGHPEDGGLVGTRWKDFSVGSSGSSVIPRIDEGLLDLVFTIGDKAAIDEAEAAAKEGRPLEVSAGYTTVVIERADGLYQTQRKYDHFAVLPRGQKARAGSSVKLHMDGVDFAVQQRTDTGDCMSTAYRNDNAVIDLLHEGIYAAKQEAKKKVITEIAEKTGYSVDSVKSVLSDFFSVPSTEFLNAAAEALDLDKNTLTALAAEVKKLEQRQRSDRRMAPVSIPLSNRVFNVDGDDAQPLADAVATLLTHSDKMSANLSVLQGESEGHKTRADKAESELKEAKDQLTKTNQDLEDTRKAKQDEQQVNFDQIIGERIGLWAQVLPTLRQNNDSFEADYSLDSTAIKRVYLLNIQPELKADEQFKTDSAYVNGLWSALKPKDNQPVKPQSQGKNDGHDFDHLLTLAQVNTDGRQSVVSDSELRSDEDKKYREDRRKLVYLYRNGGAE